MRGIGPTEYPQATNDVTLQPEFIRLHVIAKNLQGIRSEERFQDFVAELDQCVGDILMISETWRAESEEMYVTPAGGRIFLSGNGHHQGVGICISATFGKLLSDCKFHAYSNRVPPQQPTLPFGRACHRGGGQME